MNSFFKRTTTGVYLLVVAIVFVLLLFSFPENRSENDDGYFYAYAVSHADYSDLMYPRYLLFLPSMKVFYDLGRFIFPTLDAYWMMCMMSSLFAAITLPLLYHILLTRFALHRKVAFITCCILLISYGFWRYSVEAEVYALNNLLLVLIAGLLYPLAENDKKFNMPRLILAAVLAGFAVLLYKPNVIIAAVAFGIPMLLKRNWRQLFSYAAMIFIIVIAGYFTAFQINAGGYQRFLSFLLGGSSQSNGSILMSVFVVGGNIVSLNFMYAFPEVSNLIANSFPSNMIVEEVFAAQDKWMVAAISCVTILISGFLLGLIIFKTIRFVHFRQVWHNPFAVWIVAYSLMLLVLDPNSPEAWLIISLPLVVLFGTCILSVYSATKGYKIVWIFTAILLLHNLLGGISFIWSKKTDYTAYQASWILKNGTKKDVVLSLGSASMVRYILYYSPVHLCVPEQQFETCMKTIDSTLASGGNVYLLEDVLKPSKVIAYRDKAAYDKVVDFVQKNISAILPVNAGNHEEAKVFKLQYRKP